VTSTLIAWAWFIPTTSAMPSVIAQHKAPLPPSPTTPLPFPCTACCWLLAACCLSCLGCHLRGSPRAVSVRVHRLVSGVIERARIRALVLVLVLVRVLVLALAMHAQSQESQDDRGDMQRPAGYEDTRHQSVSGLRMSMDETNDYSARPRCCASLHCRAFLSRSALARTRSISHFLIHSPSPNTLRAPCCVLSVLSTVRSGLFRIASHRSPFLVHSSAVIVLLALALE
jgi:hypothetical protein